MFVSQIANILRTFLFEVILLLVRWVFLLGVLMMFVVSNMWSIYQYFSGCSYSLYVGIS